MDVVRSTVAGVLCLAAGVAVGANTWYVSLNGDNNKNDGKSMEKAFHDLWVAHQNASIGDEIILDKGTWSWDGNPSTITKAVTIRGSGNRETVFQSDGAKYVIDMNNEKAVLENVTFIATQPTAGVLGGKWEYPPAAVELKSGTLRNCTIHNFRAKDENHVSAVRMSGSATALLENCTITNNSCGKVLGAYGAVMMNNANSTVKNCEIAYNRGHGCIGFYMMNGTVTDCDIHDNVAYTTNEMGVAAAPGAGGRMDGGTLSNCFITNNISSDGGGGLWLRGGTVVNCLIANNRAALSGGGISVGDKANTLRFCNVAGNVCGDGSVGAGVYVDAGSLTCQNSLIAANGSDRENEIGFASGKTATFTYCILPTERTGTGNLVWDPSSPTFRDDGSYLTVADANYQGVDKATAVSGVEQDVLGSLRPLDGDQDGDEQPDIGCCEYNPLQTGGASASITPDRTKVAVDEQIGFTLDLKGFDATGVTAVWEVIPGEPSAPVPAVAGLTNVAMTACRNGQSVRVTVKDASGHAATAYSQPVTVLPLETFVSEDGSETWPYDTPEKATRSLLEAAQTVLAPAGRQKTITVLPGTYQLDGTLAVPEACVLRGRGELGSAVVTCAAEVSQGVLQILSYDTVVTNLAVRGGRGKGSSADRVAAASGVYMKSGLLTGCEISGCLATRDDYSTQALALDGGSADTCPIVRNCLVTNNVGQTKPVGNYSRGAGVYIGNYGLVCNTEVAGNTGSSGGVVMSGASSLLSECYVHDNHGTLTGGGVLTFGGRVERCRIVRNTCDGDTGGVRGTGSAVFENCLIADNVSALTCGGAYVGSDRLYYCTIVGNRAPTASGIRMTGSALLCNSVVGGNVADDGAEISQEESSSVKYSCVPSAMPAASNAGNVVGDPHFENAAEGDWRLAVGSPCIDAGRWDLDANVKAMSLDIVGNDRVVDGDGNGGAQADMGCYEMPYREVTDLIVNMTASKTIVPTPGAVTFTASLTGGASTTNTVFVWTFGDGTSAIVTNLLTASHTYASSGACVASVRVTDETRGWDAESEAVTVYVCASHVYVSPTGRAEMPYDTPEKAANSVATGLSMLQPGADGTAELSLDEGVYPIGSTTLDRAVRIVGKGREKTILDCGSRAGPILVHNGARLEGLCVSNVVGTAVKISNGTVSDCAIRQVVGADWNPAHGIALTGPTTAGGTCMATNCLVEDCMDSKGGTGAGVLIEGGRGVLVDSIVRRCRTDAVSDASRGGGVCVSSAGRVERCVIEDCFAYSYGGGLLVTSSAEARIVNCRIQRNSCSYWAGGGVRLDNPNAALVGCLIADNFQLTTRDLAGAGIYVGAGKLVNCTIAGNHGGASAAGLMTGGAGCYIYDTICWGNAPDPDLRAQYAPTADLETSIDAATTVDGLLAPDVDQNGSDKWQNVRPVDARLWRGTYEPKGSSPAVNAGDLTHWESFAPDVTTDLAGKRRVRGGVIDCGAFEYHGGGLAVVVR